MIIIKGPDFEMEQIKNLPFFDLKMLVKVNEGKKNEREELKIVGYGMPFEACIKEIIAYKLNSDEEVVYSISEYLTEYKKAIEQLLPFIKFKNPPEKKKKTDDPNDVDDENDDIIDEVEDANN